MIFAIKAKVSDPRAEKLGFSAQKTMYGGKHARNTNSSANLAV